MLRRAMLLGALLLACALVYGTILVQLDSAKGPEEVEFGTTSQEAQVDLYLQPVQVDAVNESLQVRVSVLPHGDSTAAIADHDFVVRVRRGKQTELVQVRANQPLPEVTLDLDLDEGDIRYYPLDRYLASTTLAASQRAQDGSELALPIHATLWEGLLGYSVSGQQLAARQPGELQLQLTIGRTHAAAFFGLALYGAMIVLTLCALTIGGLVFVGLRRVEVTLVGALGAVIFALPALRNALPGAPPLGIRADICIFFWAELGAVIALCLLVAAWARRGARP